MLIPFAFFLMLLAQDPPKPADAQSLPVPAKRGASSPAKPTPPKVREEVRAAIALLQRDAERHRLAAIELDRQVDQMLNQSAKDCGGAIDTSSIQCVVNPDAQKGPKK